jgi:hypothetical protein
MRHSFGLAFAIFASLLVFAAASAQEPPKKSCPPGLLRVYGPGPDGKVASVCASGVNRGLAGDAPRKGSVIYCRQDSECPGVSRCQYGICGRTNLGCLQNAECKYSEVCDTARKRCVDKGGKY